MLQFHNICRILLIAPLFQLPQGGADSWDVLFDYVSRQDASVVGFANKLGAYKQLIEDFKGDPRTADAMMGIVGMLESSDPVTGRESDRLAAFPWLYKAADTATPGSKTWLKAEFMLTAREMGGSPDLAKKFLKKIAEVAPNDSLAMLRVEVYWLKICSRERDLASSEAHMDKILHWYDDRSRIPQEPLVRFELESETRGAVGGLMEDYAILNEPKESRIKRIEDFMAKYGAPFVQESGENAIRRINARAAGKGNSKQKGKS